MNRLKKSTLLILIALTALAIGIHGYHLGADDAAIHIPAVKQVADPALYPFGAEFFQMHAGLSLFPQIVGYTARWTGMPADVAIFLWYAASVFLLLAAAYRIVSSCFETAHAQWAGMATLAGLLTCPVAGTALIVMDPYLTARSLSTPALLFAVAELLAGRRLRVFVWLAVALLVHPQMAFYGVVFAAVYLYYLYRSPEIRAPRAAAIALAALPVSFNLQPAQGVYREILRSHPYLFVSNWSWAEWLGVIGPLLVLWWFSRNLRRSVSPVFALACQSLIIFGLLFTAAAIILAIPPQFQNLARLQPMRAFHLIYILFFLFAGAAIGEYLLKRVTWRWLALFVPMMASMFAVQLLAFPASPHIELPLAHSPNPWLSAFFWIRTNTPKDAVFALDPNYLELPKEDLHGFRAVAERSMVADNLKDIGVAAMFPKLADEWKQQVDSLRGWQQFHASDFERLHQRYGVTWIVWQGPQPDGFICPFENGVVKVCRMSQPKP